MSDYAKLTYADKLVIEAEMQGRSLDWARIAANSLTDQEAQNAYNLAVQRGVEVNYAPRVVVQQSK